MCCQISMEDLGCIIYLQVVAIKQPHMAAKSALAVKACINERFIDTQPKTLVIIDHKRKKLSLLSDSNPGPTLPSITCALPVLSLVVCFIS